MQISNLIKKIDYSDVIFYFLCAVLFTVFLMPFSTYDPITVLQVDINGETKLINNLFQSNLHIFFGRFIVMFWGVSIALLMIILNKSIINSIINNILNFSGIVKIAILLFFVLSIISSVFAVSTTIALKGTSYLFSMLIISIFIGDYIRQKPNKIKHIYITVLVSIILYVGMLLLQLSLSNLSIDGADATLSIQKNLLFTYNTVNPRLIDNYFSWFIPFLLLPFVMNYRPILKFGSLVAISMIWFVVIEHGCRAVFAEYVVIALFLLIYDRKLFIQVFKIILITMFLGYMISMCYAYDGSSLLRNGDSNRLNIWIKAFYMGLQHPWFGVGQWNYIEYVKDSNEYPHNMLLEIWSQCGIPAFICLMIVIISALRYAFTNIKNILNVKPYNLIILMLIAGMFDSMISALFKAPIGTVGAIVVFGLCFSYYTPKHSIRASKFTLAGYRIVILSAIFFMIVAPFIWTPQWW